MPSPQQMHGFEVEDQALAMLTQAGARLEARNVRFRMGELDLVVWHEQTLVFVEVRARRSRSHGGALASVDARKQQRLIRAAQAYLQRRPGPMPPCRFDLLALEGQDWVWIRNAFS